MSVTVDLSGRVVVVTGGSRGLGLEMSRSFARAGAQVVPSLKDTWTEARVTFGP